MSASDPTTVPVDAVCCGCGESAVKYVAPRHLMGLADDADLRAEDTRVVGRSFEDVCHTCQTVKPHNVKRQLDGLDESGGTTVEEVEGSE